jgi:hypothetical protein
MPYVNGADMAMMCKGIDASGESVGVVIVGMAVAEQFSAAERDRRSISAIY